MAGGNINLAHIHKWIKLRGLIFELRRGVARVAGIVGAVRGDRVPGNRIRRLRAGHIRFVRMASAVDKTGERKGIVGAAALVIKTQRVGARKPEADPIVNAKRK